MLFGHHPCFPNRITLMTTRAPKGLILGRCVAVLTRAASDPYSIAHSQQLASSVAETIVRRPFALMRSTNRSAPPFGLGETPCVHVYQVFHIFISSRYGAFSHSVPRPVCTQNMRPMSLRRDPCDVAGNGFRSGKALTLLLGTQGMGPWWQPRSPMCLILQPQACNTSVWYALQLRMCGHDKPMCNKWTPLSP